MSNSFSKIDKDFDLFSEEEKVGKLVWAECGCCSRTDYVGYDEPGLNELLDHQLYLINKLLEVGEAIKKIQDRIYKDTV